MDGYARCVPDMEFKVVAETDRFVVIDKPSGMLSVPGKGAEKADCAAARVRTMFPRATGPLVVHRLDMETSGLLIFGLDPDAQRELSRQFEQRIVEKRYTALLAGLVWPEAGEIDLPIRADLSRRPIQIVDFEQGRPSKTLYRVITHETDRTRVWFTPVTGRSHQLRVHAAEGLKAPILGDPLYGDAGSFPRLALHASMLAVRDVETGRRVEFVSTAEF